VCVEGGSFLLVLEIARSGLGDTKNNVMSFIFIVGVLLFFFFVGGRLVVFVSLFSQLVIGVVFRWHLLH